MVYRILLYSKKCSSNIFGQTLCTLANFFQFDYLAKIYNYSFIFSELRDNFKIFIKKYKIYEFYIIAMILSILKSQNFILANFVPKKQNLTHEYSFLKPKSNSAGIIKKLWL